MKLLNGEKNMKSVRKINVYFDDGLNPQSYLGHLDMVLGQDVDLLVLEAMETYLDPREVDFSLITGELKGFNLVLGITSELSFNTPEIIETRVGKAPAEIKSPFLAYD